MCSPLPLLRSLVTFTSAQSATWSSSHQLIGDGLAPCFARLIGLLVFALLEWALAVPGSSSPASGLHLLLPSGACQVLVLCQPQHLSLPISCPVLEAQPSSLLSVSEASVCRRVLLPRVLSRGWQGRDCATPWTFGNVWRHFRWPQLQEC